MRKLEEDDALLCDLKCPAHSFPQGSASHCFQGLREGGWGFLGGGGRDACLFWDFLGVF